MFDTKNPLKEKASKLPCPQETAYSRVLYTHKFIFDAVIVIITITDISDSISVHVPLTTVRNLRTVVLQNSISNASDLIPLLRDPIRALYNYKLCKRT